MESYETEEKFVEERIKNFNINFQIDLNLLSFKPRGGFTKKRTQNNEVIMVYFNFF
jgi:hypothetical protein